MLDVFVAYLITSIAMPPLAHPPVEETQSSICCFERISKVSVLIALADSMVPVDEKVQQDRQDP